MIVDTSALLAILLCEPEAKRFAGIIDKAPVVRMSVASYTEAALFVERRADPVRREMFDSFFEDSGIVLEPVTVDQARLARQAFHAFGKSRHPAGLNYGDCFTYALAKAMREPLLYKGNDFAQTDLIPAIGEESGLDVL
jgi:ribonuclease VapC